MAHSIVNAATNTVLISGHLLQKNVHDDIVVSSRIQKTGNTWWITPAVFPSLKSAIKFSERRFSTTSVSYFPEISAMLCYFPYIFRFSKQNKWSPLLHILVKKCSKILWWLHLLHFHWSQSHHKFCHLRDCMISHVCTVICWKSTLA